MRASVVSRRSRVTRTSSAPRPLMRAGEHLVARRLVDRQRFAGDRRLVDRAVPRDDLAVERNLLARLDDDDRAGRDRRRRPTRRSPAASRTSASAGVRSISARIGVARAFERPRFERLRDGEQEDDGGRLGPLAERDRAGGGDEHQHVDVERRAARSDCQALRAVERHAGGDRRARRAAAGTPRRAPDALAGSARAPARRRTSRRASAACARPAASPAIGSSCSSQARMPASATAAAIVDGRQLGGVVFHVQPLPHQVGGEVLEAGQVLEPPLEQRDFLAAVHAFDLEGRLGVQLADGAGGRSCALRPPSRRSVPGRAPAPARRGRRCAGRRGCRRSAGRRGAAGRAACRAAAGAGGRPRTAEPEHARRGRTTSTSVRESASRMRTRVVSPSTLKVSARSIDRRVVEQPGLQSEHMSDVLICSV